MAGNHSNIVSYFRLAIVALFGLLMVACENDPEEVAALGRKRQETEVGYDIKGDFSQSANLKADLTAPMMVRVKADTPYTEFPKSIHVNFYKEDNSIESVVEAKYAKYFESIGKVYLRDSVVIYSKNGDTLHCEDLWWDQNAAVFYTDKNVVIHTPTQLLYGSGLWALSNFSKYTIKNTSGSVAIPDSITP
jgi:LPS export ABC transporter protein LptC